MALTFRFATALIGQRLCQSAARQYCKSISVGEPIVHKVYPFSNIKITSNYHLNIKPYDLLDCPDGNLLRVSLKPKQLAESSISAKIREFLANFDATIQIDDQNIVIDTVDNLGKQINADELANAVVCLIEVPVKANLKVSSARDVIIQNMYSDEVNVITNDGDVTTKNLHAVSINLMAQNGHIRCEGSTLGQKIEIRSHGNKVCIIVKVAIQQTTKPLNIEALNNHFHSVFYFIRFAGYSFESGVGRFIDSNQ